MKALTMFAGLKHQAHRARQKLSTTLTIDDEPKTDFCSMYYERLRTACSVTLYIIDPSKRIPLRLFMHQLINLQEVGGDLVCVESQAVNSPSFDQRPPIVFIRDHSLETCTD